MIVSTDEGATWSTPRRLNRPGEHSLVLLNDSAVRLSDGRLILPTYRGHSPYAPDPGLVQPVLSDDDATWFPAACRLGRPVGDRAVITYDVAPSPGCALKLRVLPASWFYETE